ncbi:AbrB/MazE/SpoVT family DNA-binding domain-containing protein [Deinococcus sp. SDU3-2]|uniref:AbrB/MazE/SpoVT family DNA-binding domain-containing protein n=1 Tax=Deinococcus terrestris TaxID=2651870 RepID=A0A7X1NVB6_9DEIO|nr:AbrB/MazE/SpoVT family DNA-binding domain-containing protein [Deinococcus terrestris]MPY66473.1 AbrB/MazE/SpoVT family DNA-binding domain-containing protein [Deinococcus terrestris]
MARHRTFKSGNSQEVRNPPERQPSDDEGRIARRGRKLIITLVQGQDGRATFEALAAFDGPIEREQPAMQQREVLEDG